MTDTYVPTRYLSLSTLNDGSLILHCSRTGAIGAVPPEQARIVREALQRSARHEGPLTGTLHDLAEGGFLIPEDTDERALVHEQYLTKYDDRSLELIIMPTEECNFRCPYCYESFERGPMPPELREGIRRYVRGQRNLRRLDIEWFGGEPLLEPDIVIELTRFFEAHCAEHGIEYTGGMTTNGSLLTPDVAGEIIPRGVHHFQITLDGLQHDHDCSRIRLGGGGSFDDIMANLRYLHNSELPFHIMIRHNFAPKTLPRLPEFIAMLKHEFGGDPRFTTHFSPIGKWGGPNDKDLSVCEGRSGGREMIRARRLAIEAGFRNGLQLDCLRPNAFVCYAADPRSFVIGSDGRIYKCTVELDYHDRNIVGRLHPDGTMDLDWRKMALWCETNGLDAGKKCGNCFFSPTCYGAVCPKQWLEANDCTCPEERVFIHDVLPLFALESRMAPPPVAHGAAHCAHE